MYADFDSLETFTRPDHEKAVYALEQGDLSAFCRETVNVFRPLWSESDVPFIRQKLLENGALCASLTGSGPTVFGIFENDADARKCLEILRKKIPFVRLCRPD